MGSHDRADHGRNQFDLRLRGFDEPRGYGDHRGPRLRPNPRMPIPPGPGGIPSAQPSPSKTG
jgi:hypothetical protein